MRLQGSGQRDPALVRAQALLDWLRDRKEFETSFREVMRKGPAPTRLKAQADAALQVLAAHHWVQVMDDQPRNRPKIVRLLWRDTP